VNPISIACVVEGDGEIGSVPVLIRRVAQRLDPGLVVHLPRPVKVRRNRLTERFFDLQRGIERAIGSIRLPGAVFILLDSDEDCPAQLGPDLLRRSAAVRGDVPMAVVLAKHEYEAWFLAASESLRGKCGLPDDLQPPSDPEAVRDAKGWLRAQMLKGRRYSETVDQPKLTANLDFDRARARSDSFDKCHREIERLIQFLTQA
jgi:hypothetical protein